MRNFGGFLGQGFVMEFACFVRVKAEIELVVPAEFKACLAQGIIAYLRAGMAFGEVSGNGRRSCR